MDGPKRRLVEKDSATHGRSFEEQVHKVQPINHNHQEMVKFGNNSSDYRRVLTSLEDITRASDGFTVGRYRSEKEGKLL